MFEYLSGLNIDFVIVANKIDKLNREKRIKNLETIQKECKEHPVVPYSAVTNEGRNELLRYIEKRFV